MIYLASRSHPKYLAKLREIAAREVSYPLVTIAGGLAFLHALNSRTRSLVVVDKDPEVMSYTSWMVELLRMCAHRWEFFEVLSGHMTDRATAGRLSFTDQRSEMRARLLQTGSPGSMAHEIHRELEHLYPVGQFHPAQQILISPAGTVHFDGLTLDPMHFNWMNGFGAFEAEATYAEMRKALILLQPTYHTMALEDFDFSRCENGTLVLASNTDSPLFTRNDPVLNAIEQANTKQLFYLSRTRDTGSHEVGNEQPLAQATLVMSPVAVNLSERLHGELARLYPFGWRQISASTYVQSELYDEECALFFFEAEGDKDSEELLAALQHTNPIHQRIVVVALDDSGIHERIEQVLARYKSVEEARVGGYRAVVFRLRYGVPYR